MPVEKESSFRMIDAQGNVTEHKSIMMVNTKEENLQSLQEYPFCIASIDYFATGEGRTIWLLAKRAKNLDEFKGWVAGKIDAYYAAGADYYVNELPEAKNSAVVVLASKFTLKLWADIIDGETESGHYVFYAEQHMNLS